LRWLNEAGINCDAVEMQEIRVFAEVYTSGTLAFRGRGERNTHPYYGVLK